MVPMMVAVLIQLTPPAEAAPIEIPDSALRDPHGFLLSQCSPLVRRSTESLDACEHRVGEALRARLPEFRLRPLTSTVAASENDVTTAATGSAFGGRCTTRQEHQEGEEGSSSSRSIVCGDRSGAAAQALEEALRPR